jgi:hypothetical protein
MLIYKQISITIDSPQDIRNLRELVELGLIRLEDVDKEVWGDKYTEVKTWGELFLEQTNID